MAEIVRTHILHNTSFNKEDNKMAKLTKKQEEQYQNLFSLFHKMITAKMNNKRADYEDTVSKIREEVKEDDEK